MQFREFSGKTIVLALCTSFAASLACAAGKPSPSGTGPSPQAGAGGAAQGGSVSLGGSGSGIAVGGGPSGPAGPNWIPDDLPAPWQYYDEGAERAYKDEALPEGVRDQFAGPPAEPGELAIVYPLNGALHPVNQSHVLFQWHRGAETNTVFRIDALGDDGRSSRYYVPCNSLNASHQCTYQMPASDWLWLASDYRGSQVTITISASDGQGGAVATSAALSAHFSPEPVYGALYYWAASMHALKRANFESEGSVAYITPESETNQFKCVACHSISRDGNVIAFAVSNLSGETVAAIQTAPTEDPASPYVAPAMGTTPFPAHQAHAGDGEAGSLEDQPMDHHGHNVALNPDGSIAAVNGIPAPPEDEDGWPPFFELRDTKTGATINRYLMGDAPFAPETMLIMPEWSPDGTKLVGAVFKGDDPCRWTYTTAGSDIAVFPVQDGQTLGEPSVVATASDPLEFHFYPTWSADGQWVAFMSAKREPDPESTNPCLNTNSSFNQNAVIRMVRVDGQTHTCPGADCIELEAGTQYSVEDAFTNHLGKHTTWPKFTPFVQGQAGNVMFLSFTSGIDYGFVSTAAQNAPRSYARNQIWMFGIDVSKVGSGDPSYAPVWLPQQDPADGSLTPYWTETLPCQSDPAGGCVGCAAGEECHVSSANVCACRAIPVK